MGTTVGLPACADCGGSVDPPLIEDKEELTLSGGLQPGHKPTAKVEWENKVVDSGGNASHSAVEGNWIHPSAANFVPTKSKEPEFRSIPGGAGEFMYAIGGMGREAGEKNQLASVERFDFATQRWFETNPLSARRLGAAAAVIPGFGLFVCGGFDGSRHLASVELLNSANGKWEKQPSMPEPRTFAGVGVMNGKLYVVGGLMGMPGGLSVTTNKLACYDPRDKSWTELEPMATARLGPGVACMSGALYVVGGADETGKVLCSGELFYRNSWSPTPDMAIARGAPGVAVLDNHMYVVGGCDDNGDPMRDVEVLVIRKHQVARVETGDIEEMDELQWKISEPMITARAGLGCCSSGNVVVAIGGCGNGLHYLDVVEWYDPRQKCWSRSTALSTGRRYPAVVCTKM